MKAPQTVSWRVKLIGFGVRLVSFLLETFPGLPGHQWPPGSTVTLLAQTLISSGILFIMINAEMINGNANDGVVPQPSALSVINAFPLLNPSLSSDACVQRGTWLAARTPSRAPAGQTWQGFPPHMLLFIFCWIFVWQPEFQYISSWDDNYFGSISK